MAKNKPPIPLFDFPIIETHCHLDYLKQDEIASIVQKSSDLGIEKIISIAVSKDNLTNVIEICDRFDTVYGTQGIHPHQADEYNEQLDSILRSQLSHQKILAVGEIGLDYYYEHSQPEIQRNAFEQQLQIASDLDLPVVIHTREADEDMQAILSNFSNTLPKKGVIHSFTSSLSLAEFCINEGFHLGFNGIITFNRADNVRNVLEKIPMDRILTETDAPYLTPAPYRGKENAPFYLPFIVEKIAHIKKLPIDEVLKSCYNNAHQVFFDSLQEK